MKQVFNAKVFRIGFLLLVLTALSSCKISYKFNGGTIDYTKTKSISVADFPNNAEYVYPQLSQDFTEGLRDIYTKQTRLKVLKKGGDMHVEGEITEFRTMPVGVSADSYAAENRLTVTVKVRYTNNKNPEDDFEKSYSSSRNYPGAKLLVDVQESICKEIIAEIVDNIYNDTVAKW